MHHGGVKRGDITAAIKSLGLAGLPLCVHSSLRSFGWVEGGARTMVVGLLDAGCTVMVPTFLYEFGVSPPANRRHTRNGTDYDQEVWPGEQRNDVYSPESVEIDSDMGTIPAAIVNMPDRVRGNHPSDSFSAVGPLAKELIEGQTPHDVYAPLEELERRQGSVVLMGVNLTRMTLIHLAEHRAGRTLCRRWARGPSGEIIETRIGTCSQGFERLRPFVSPVERSIDVGASHWRIYPVAETLPLAADAIRRNPEITHCPDPDCINCRDAVLGGPILDGV